MFIIIYLIIFFLLFKRSNVTYHKIISLAIHIYWYIGVKNVYWCPWGQFRFLLTFVWSYYFHHYYLMLLNRLFALRSGCNHNVYDHYRYDERKYFFRKSIFMRITYEMKFFWNFLLYHHHYLKSLVLISIVMHSSFIYMFKQQYAGVCGNSSFCTYKHFCGVTIHTVFEQLHAKIIVTVPIITPVNCENSFHDEVMWALVQLWNEKEVSHLHTPVRSNSSLFINFGNVLCNLFFSHIYCEKFWYSRTCIEKGSLNINEELLLYAYQV